VLLKKDLPVEIEIFQGQNTKLLIKIRVDK
jgi:hypothetical protein